MNKLLSEQELRADIEKAYNESVMMGRLRTGSPIDYMKGYIIALVESQKLAHGEMVIGDSKGINPNSKDFYDGYVLAQTEARERNKS